MKHPMNCSRISGNPGVRQNGVVVHITAPSLAAFAGLSFGPWPGPVTTTGNTVVSSRSEFKISGIRAQIVQSVRKSGLKDEVAEHFC